MGRATRLPRRSPRSSWNWKTLWRMASICGKAVERGFTEPMHQTQRRMPSTRCRKKTNRKHNSGVTGPIRSCASRSKKKKPANHMCFAPLVEMFGYSYDPQVRDPTRKRLRCKVRQDGRFIGVMDCHDKRKTNTSIATKTRNGLCGNMGFVFSRISRLRASQ